MMRKKIYIVLVFMLALTPISATTITDKKNQLSSAKQDIEVAKEELEITKEEKAALQKVFKIISFRPFCLFSQGLFTKRHFSPLFT